MTNPFANHAAATATAPAPQFTPQFGAPQQPTPQANGMGAASQFAPQANGSAQQAPAFAPSPAATTQPEQSGGANTSLGFDPNDGADPFAMPGGMSSEKINAHVGELLLIRPTDFVAQMPTSQGPRDTIFCDMATLDRQDEAGTIYVGMRVFQAPLVRELKKVYEGGLPYMLGRLARGAAKNGQVDKAPYIFTKPTPEDAERARKFLAYLKSTGQSF